MDKQTIKLLEGLLYSESGFSYMEKRNPLLESYGREIGQYLIYANTLIKELRAIPAGTRIAQRSVAVKAQKFGYAKLLQQECCFVCDNKKALKTLPYHTISDYLKKDLGMAWHEELGQQALICKAYEMLRNLNKHIDELFPSIINDELDKFRDYTNVVVNVLRLEEKEVIRLFNQAAVKIEEQSLERYIGKRVCHDACWRLTKNLTKETYLLSLVTDNAADRKLV